MNDRAPAPGGLALVQSLVNTLDLESGADSLDTAEGLARLGLTPDEVPAARELRESLRAVCLAHAGHPAHAVVTPLGELLARAPLRVAVDAHDGAASLAPAGPFPFPAQDSPGTPFAPDSPGTPSAPVPLTSRIALAIGGALVEGTWTRLKACEAPDCHWAYFDRSPACRGRWCSMSVCGARAKMRRYRAK
ncbi:CGNR zinc finger domain-containing protein [Streptomyces sp. NPDC007084]|uniref:CGNR zinc finger domain-containing protein n=1 Tax=Streptomyces sp. NPDC007084 TaxID=3154313 RepID=UPI0034552EF1